MWAPGLCWKFFSDGPREILGIATARAGSDLEAAQQAAGAGQPTTGGKGRTRFDDSGDARLHTLRTAYAH